MGRENGVKLLGLLNNAQEVAKEMQSWKAAVLDGCVADCLKNGSTNVIEWLVRLLKVLFLTRW